MFIIILKYEYGLKLVDQHVEAHRKYLDKYYTLGRFICSGAQIPRTGGIILCNAKTRNEVDEIISEDPFFKNNAVKYEVIEFTPGKYAPGFENFINR
jgi:uncharacterized protein YciI